VPRLNLVSLSSFFEYCVDNKLPCAFYHQPDSTDIQVIAQNNSGLNKLKTHHDQGFLFAPFQQDKSAEQILIRPDIFVNSKNLPNLNFAPKVAVQKVNKIKQPKLKATGKKAYKQYVKDILKHIKKGGIKKVVAARIVLKRKPKHFNAVQNFQHLCKAYSASFVSLVFTPQYGLWIGATPEILLQHNQSGFKTYALAGTRANTPQNLKSPWSDKEKSEHKIVSAYILKAFQSVSNTAPTIKGPETIVAGNLLHLRTVFEHAAIPKIKWLKLVDKLHPTPAVAGLPAKKAIRLILKNERSGRSFYSGYLGPVNMNNEINLFVNLRCMQVLKKQLAIYAGCGVVADSKPEDEWKESTLKTRTLLNVLKQL
jgi:isochorismate synthase